MSFAGVNQTALEDLYPLPRIPKTEEVVVIELELSDLQDFLFIFNGGLLRIKELAGKNPDLHDQRALKAGRIILDSISKEYRELTKKRKGASDESF